MKLFPVSIVSKSCLKVRLCCKQGEQDVTRDLKILRENLLLCTTSIMFFYSIAIKKVLLIMERGVAM